MFFFYTSPLIPVILIMLVIVIAFITWLVLLPLESHGYAARESVEHALYEMITWFDRYVKNAQPKAPASPSQ